MNLNSLVLVWVLLLISIDKSQARLWQSLAVNNDIHSSDMGFDIPVSRYHLLEFNQQSLSDLNDASTQIELPLPNGQFESFELTEVSIMEKALADKFPEIKTYRGHSIANRNTTVVMDVTPKGLHAVIKSTDFSVWIDPVHRHDRIRHISYYQSDYTHKSHQWHCAVDDVQQAHSEVINHSISPIINRGALPSNEMTLKNYRIAVATTGEYATFHSSPNAPNVPDTMAAIVTAMNRVNGIYETELGIRMILVANNDQIVFTDPDTDGYTNSNGFAMLSQNQSIIDNVIGFNNYDIGHVFSTGGGGIAGLGVPCGSRKAEGVTGLSSPINDIFYVDYVSHEIGHQWDAPHVFNSVASFCNGNRSAGSAVEPGSGTTILSYAGICGADNIQNRSDAYFNLTSLSSITDYTNGFGASCVDIMNTGNQAPQVDGGIDYNIPQNTPFELCAQASDVDSTNITYNWEQQDLGPAGSPNSPVGNAPIFRSFEATNNPCRTFPQMPDILNQTQTLGEILPSYSRSLNFMITVRDNELTGGAFATDQVQLTVTDDGPFGITSQTTTEILNGGQALNVTWNVGNTDQVPIACSLIDVLFSQDGGQSFNLHTQVNNNGSANVAVPFLNTNQARIKLKCANNVFFDINQADLTIQSTDLIYMNGFE